MSRSNNKQGPIVGVGAFEPLGSSGSAIVAASPFQPFGSSATASGRWIRKSTASDAAGAAEILTVAVKTVVITLVQLDGKGGGDATAAKNTRRRVNLFIRAAGGNITSVTINQGLGQLDPAIAGGIATVAMTAIPTTLGVFQATIVFSAAQANNIVIYDDGQQQFECNVTTV